jgi:hypothetical protein
MEEVLVQSISESGIDQPLTGGKLEQDMNGTLSAEFVMPVIEARSVQELNSQFAQLKGEALECATSDSNFDDEPIQDISSEALPGHTSELPTENGHSSYPTLDNSVDVNVECKSREMLTDGSELPVLESRVEGMNSLLRQLDDEASAQMPHSPDLMVGEHNGDIDSGVVVPDGKSSEGISSSFVHLLSNDDEKIKIPGDGEVILGSEELNSGLHVMETNHLEGIDTSGFDSTKAIEMKESLERD